MSEAVNTVICSNCDFEGSARKRVCFYYELHDGNLVQFSSSLGWCEDCNTTVDIEDLQSLKEVKPEMESLELKIHEVKEELNKVNSSFMDKLFFRKRDPLKRTLGDLESKYKYYSGYLPLLPFLEKRKSPPKCLECGSTGIEKIPDNDTYLDLEETVNLGFTHPGCGGELKEGCFIQLIYSDDPPEVIYDCEGNKIS